MHTLDNVAWRYKLPDNFLDSFSTIETFEATEVAGTSAVSQYGSYHWQQECDK